MPTTQPTKQFTIHSLFPVCHVPTCQSYGHRHALPWQYDLFKHPEQYIYCQGGVGSAKTIAFACLFALDMLLVPNNRGIIFRKDFNLNYKTAWLRFNECLDGLVEQGFIPPVVRSVKKFGEYTKVLLANGSTIEAGQSKNWSEYLGPEYGSVWVDDAMESLAEMWIGVGTSGGLESRIRHSAAAYAKVNGVLTNRLRGYISTNPPPGVSDWWVLFGKTPGVRAYEGTSVNYRHIQVSSKDNDHLPPNYLEMLAAHHNEEERQRIIEGKSVVYYGGKGVYRDYYQTRRHVGEFLYTPEQPLFVSVDFGYQHPAITYSQIRVCPFETEHHITLSEVTSLYDVSILDVMAAHHQHLSQHYSKQDAGLIFYCCDIAGFKSTDVTEDKRGPARIWQDQYAITFEKRHFDLAYSHDYMRQKFDARHQCLCGFSQILIDKSCNMLIEAYEGGYRFPQRKDGTYGPKPVADHRYEDPADAHRYSVEHFLRLGHGYHQWRSVAHAKQRLALAQPAMFQEPWQWMLGSDVTHMANRHAY